MKCLDKYGYPVTWFKGKPITNFIRKIIHTRKIVMRWEPPKQKADPSCLTCGDYLTKDIAK